MRRSEGSAVVWGFPDCHESASCRNFLKDLDSFLADKYQPRVVFDLSTVQTMNALSIDLLLTCVMRISSRDGELRLASASTQTSLVLELTQLNQVVEVFPTVADATSSFDAPYFQEKLGESRGRAV